MDKSSGESRTLIFSQRNLTRVMPFRCPHFEFEDVIAEVDAVDILAPRFDPTTWRHAITKKFAFHTPLAMNPGIKAKTLRGSYDLFFAICADPADLLRIHALGDWRSKCRKAVCLVDELWVRQMGGYKNFLRMMRKFDLVILYYSQTVQPLSDYVGTRCIFLPPGVDAVRFCPWPNPADRVVDVYSIGRRSGITHRALLEMAVHDDYFYLHDSITPDQVLDAAEHRALFANIVKRSRYFIVNPGLIDRPEIRGDQIEIGNRYFESAASGSIMVGERPRNGEFEKLIDWPDALVEVPYNSPDIAGVLRALDRDPGKLEYMRRVNVSHALMRHDWVYRWEAILQAVGMEPLPGLTERKQRLRNLAAIALPDRQTAAADEKVSLTAGFRTPNLASPTVAAR